VVAALYFRPIRDGGHALHRKYDSLSLFQIATCRTVAYYRTARPHPRRHYSIGIVRTVSKDIALANATQNFVLVP
jgi:hypothetical protein